MVYLINEDTIFTLYNGDIEDLDFGTFLDIYSKRVSNSWFNISA